MTPARKVAVSLLVAAVVFFALAPLVLAYLTEPVARPTPLESEVVR